MKKDKDIEIIKAIDNYVNGRLGPEETDQLWARLLERPEYYELLRTEAALKKRYDNRMQESVQEYGSGETIDQDDAGPKNSTRKTGAVRLGHAPWLLAAAVVVVGVFIYLYQNVIDGGAHGPAITEIPLTGMLAPDVYRSSSIQLDGIDEKLSRAFLYTVSGETDRAVAAYREIISLGSHGDSARFNIGIIYFNKGEYKLSASEFSKTDCFAFKAEGLAERCLWYQLNSFLGADQLDAAEETAILLIDREGRYRAESEQIMRRLKN